MAQKRNFQQRPSDSCETTIHEAFVFLSSHYSTVSLGKWLMQKIKWRFQGERYLPLNLDKHYVIKSLNEEQEYTGNPK